MKPPYACASVQDRRPLRLAEVTAAPLRLRTVIVTMSGPSGNTLEPSVDETVVEGDAEAVTDTAVYS